MSDDRDMLVRGFESHLKDVVMTGDEAKDYCRALEKMPLRLPVKKAIREIIRSCVPPPPVTITTQHAKDITALVTWFRNMIQARNMPGKDDKSVNLSSSYCDGLLEDLEQ